MASTPILPEEESAMTRIVTCRVRGNPPPWTVTGVNRFLVGALERIASLGTPLPERFRLSVCPWGERNQLGGTPAPVQAVTDPRLRLVHFTGCGRPYLLALFQGDDAGARQDIAMRHLPWSEHFTVTLAGDQAELTYLDCTEALWDDAADDHPPRTLQALFASGELAAF
jgi:hypothetical protein